MTPTIHHTPSGAESGIAVDLRSVFGDVSVATVIAYRRLVFATGAHKVGSEQEPLPVPVEGTDAALCVKVASTDDEWQQAFNLVAQRMHKRRDDGGATKRFVRYHALPETVTFVAKHENVVEATVSMIGDNPLLGLPMETLFSNEIDVLRQQERRIAEATWFASSDGLCGNEFQLATMALIRLMKQYHRRNFVGDTWVVAIDPRHSSFCTKVLGYIPLGPRRHNGAAGNIQAYMVDVKLMQENVPETYRAVVDSELPDEALQPPLMPADVLQTLTTLADPANGHRQGGFAVA